MNRLKTGRKKWCPGWESNPHEEKSPEDFKSSASAIPPPGHKHYKSNEQKDLLQHYDLRLWLLKDSGVGSGVGWSLCRSVQALNGRQCVLRSEVRVPHGHASGFVAEKLLHSANIHACHHEAACERVTQTMPAEICDLGIREHGLEPAPRFLCATANEFRGRMLLAESFERLNRTLIELDVSHRAVLAARDRETAQGDGNIKLSGVSSKKGVT